jgi:ABC-2 type transport system ATP-binding protein
MSNKALEVSNLNKTYANGFSALKNINLTIDAGDFFALLGPNGAGKTSLIGIITTLVAKTAGTVKLFGHDITTDTFEAKKTIGVVPQEINLPSFETCWQILLQQAGFYGIDKVTAKERAEKYLKELVLWEKKDTQTIMLSGGMKRRLMIARALMHEPRLLILDEPTAGVDIEIRHSMWKFLGGINKAGTTILLTTHYLEEAENLCNKTALINFGNIEYQGEMHIFLEQLEEETVTLHLNKERTCDLPEVSEWSWKMVDPKSIEARLPKEVAVSDLIKKLECKDFKVVRVTNKLNRLEELFLNITQQAEQKRT